MSHVLDDVLLREAVILKNVNALPIVAKPFFDKPVVVPAADVEAAPGHFSGYIIKPFGGKGRKVPSVLVEESQGP
jgi:hypothetical protein